MRRKPGALLPLELAILGAVIELQARGADGVHGYLLATALKQQADSRLLTAHGTLYKALGRLTDRGLLESQWEDPAVAATEERPRRRLYRITALGESASRSAARVDPGAQPGWQPA